MMEAVSSSSSSDIIVEQENAAPSNSELASTDAPASPTGRSRRASTANATKATKSASRSSGGSSSPRKSLPPIPKEPRLKSKNGEKDRYKGRVFWAKLGKHQMWPAYESKSDDLDVDELRKTRAIFPSLHDLLIQHEKEIPNPSMEATMQNIMNAFNVQRQRLNQEHQAQRMQLEHAYNAREQQIASMQTEAAAAEAIKQQIMLEKEQMKARQQQQHDVENSMQGRFFADQIARAKASIPPLRAARKLTSDELIALCKGTGNTIISFLGTHTLGMMKRGDEIDYTPHYGKFSGKIRSRIFRLAIEEADEVVLMQESTLRNEDEAQVCAVSGKLLNDSDGPILMCDRCDRGVYIQCTGLTEVPETSYFCPDCCRDAPLTVEAARKLEAAQAKRDAIEAEKKRVQEEKKRIRAEKRKRKGGTKKQKPPKKAKAPKVAKVPLPKSAYAIFLSDFKRTTTKGTPMPEVRVAAKQLWETMDAEKREPYQKRSDQMREEALKAGIIKPKVKKVQLVFDAATGQMVPKKTKKQIAAEKRKVREEQAKVRRAEKAAKAAAAKIARENERQKQYRIRAEKARDVQVSKIDARISQIEAKLLDIQPPVDDFELPRRPTAGDADAVPDSNDVEDEARALPDPDGCLASPEEVKLLHIWDFLMAFSKTLGLSFFSFEDFRSSVSCDIPGQATPLAVVETHLALMRILLDDIEHKARKDKKAISADGAASAAPSKPPQASSKSPSKATSREGPKSPRSPRSPRPAKLLQIGDVVDALYGSGEEWFRGVIVAVHRAQTLSEVTYDIRYEDGDTEKHVSRARIKPHGVIVPVNDPPALIPGSLSSLPTTHMLSVVTWQETLRCTIGWLVESGRCILLDGERRAALSGCARLGISCYQELSFDEKVSILKLLRSAAEMTSALQSAVKKHAATRRELRSQWRAKVSDINKRIEKKKKNKEGENGEEDGADGAVEDEDAAKKVSKRRKKPQKKEKEKEKGDAVQVEIVEIPPDGISPHEESEDEESEEEEEEEEDSEEEASEDDSEEDDSEEEEASEEEDAMDESDSDKKKKTKDSEETLTEEEASKIVGMSRSQLRKLQLQKRQEAAKAKEMERAAQEKEAERKREEMEVRLARKRTRDRRRKAVQEMKDAYKARDVVRLKEAIEAARTAGLEGGTRKKLWRLPELDVALKQYKRLEIEADKERVNTEHHEKMRMFPIFKRHIGSDRDSSRYWLIRGKERIDRALHGELAIPGRLFVQRFQEDGPDTWAYYVNVHKVRDMIAALSDGGIRERELKKELQIILGESLKYDMNTISAKLVRTFDPEAAEEGEDADIPSWETEGHNLIGKRVRRVIDEHVLSATIVAYRDLEEDGETAPALESEDSDSKKNKKKRKRKKNKRHFTIVYNDGDMSDVEEDAVTDALEMDDASAFIPPGWERSGDRVGKFVARSEKKSSYVGVVTSTKAYSAKDIQRDPTMKRCLYSFESTLTSSSTVLICDGCEAECLLKHTGLSSVPKGDFFCYLCQKEKAKESEGDDKMETENDEGEGEKKKDFFHVHYEDGFQMNYLEDELVERIGEYKEMNAALQWSNSSGYFRAPYAGGEKHTLRDSGIEGVSKVLQSIASDSASCMSKAKWPSGGTSSSFRRQVQSCTCLADLKDHLEKLEGAARSLQTEEDEKEKEVWLTEGHPFVGKKVRRLFNNVSGAVDGKITKYLPANGKQPALFHMVHDDGDEEDLEYVEAKEAINNAKEGVEGWVTEGHDFIGKRACRVFNGSNTLGTITAYLPAHDDDPELFHIVHDDGDEEDVEHKDTKEAVERYDAIGEDEEDEDDDDDGSEDEDEEEEESDEDDDVSDSEESDSDEEVEEVRTKLWPSFEAREAWKARVKDSRTTSQLGVCALSLWDHMVSFGLVSERRTFQMRGVSRSKSSRHTHKVESEARAMSNYKQWHLPSKTAEE